MAAVVLFLASAALAAGFFLPDLVGRVADRKLGSEAETFVIDKVPSAADARLLDMLRLADIYENEVYLDSGAVRDESDMRITAADLIKRLSGCGVLDKAEYEVLSLSPFIAVRGKMLSDDSYGYDDTDNTASTGDVSEYAAESSDQTAADNGAQMGIIWKCYVSCQQPGIDLEILIDDRSGKMLSFSLTRYVADTDTEEEYRNEEEINKEINKEIQEDLRGKSDGMQTFCEEYYGFRYTDREYHVKDESCFARLFFEDENGDNIMLDLERDRYGTVYTWNRTF